MRSLDSHLLLDGVLPKSVTIFLVEAYAVIEWIWDFDSILVSALLVASIHSGFDSIPLCE
jgi:hypothetical protein